MRIAFAFIAGMTLGALAVSAALRPAPAPPRYVGTECVVGPMQLAPPRPPPVTEWSL